MVESRESLKFSSESRLAVIAGEGDLPHLIYEEMNKLHVEVLFFCPPNIPAKILGNKALIRFDPMDLESLFVDFEKRNIKNIIFAGKITRSTAIYSEEQKKDNLFFREIYPFLHETDNKLLKKIGSLFETQGLKIKGILEILPDSVASKGILTKKKPSPQDLQDVLKAIEYHKTLSKADIGQSLVVSLGLCLAVETLPGTDEMLDFVKSSKCKGFLRPYVKSGLLYKALKEDQDIRFDVPVIGVNTLRKVREANLKGLALQENTVILLNKQRIVQLADELGLFIVVV